MINSFDNFFLNNIPNYNNLYIHLISKFADPLLHLIFCFFFCCILYKRKKTKIIDTIAFYFLTQTCLIMFICGILKITIGRARPFLLEQNIAGFYAFSINHSFLSFPSSHTAIATSLTYWIISTYKESRLVYLFPLFPLLIGFTRICLKAHFASDVLMGGCIGLFIGYMVKQNFKKYIIKFLYLLNIY